MNGTRVVFPERERDVTMRVENTSEQPVLAQSWIDDGRVDVPPEQLQVPFVVAPALKRVEPGRSAVLRITHTPASLPGDRESIYWLNVLEVPASQKDSDNQLRFGFRTRIKLFYRPAAIADGVDAAPDQLVWKTAPASPGTGERHVVLEVANPTPYYVSFGKVESDAGGPFVSAGGGMVAPFGHARFALPGVVAAARKPATVRYMIIDDYGGRTTITKKLAN
ncbi:molecular chaperone [Burkholderia cenocepacia]|uniref:Molecular chaperone n=1 Tax=Burkholderia cenocepacia TaxID=95486 RepID=A0A3S9NAN8_9BURK|nr:molecular chaperone [Burkholderia cenocepacia]